MALDLSGITLVRSQSGTLGIYREGERIFEGNEIEPRQLLRLLDVQFQFLYSVDRPPRLLRDLQTPEMKRDKERLEEAADLREQAAELEARATELEAPEAP